MAYVEPGSYVRLLSNVPIDKTHRNTLFFSDESSQSNYFNTGDYYGRLSYQRVNSNVIRVEASVRSAIDINYLVFSNTVHERKRYYAFVDSVNYINENCIEITYTIDVIQTYFFDYLISGFVEREHTLTDEIGDNILPENVNCGEYVYNGEYTTLYPMTKMCTIISIVDTSKTVDGTLYDGIYGSATLFAYNSDDVTGINEKIEEYIQSPDSILSIYMCPINFIGGSIPTGHQIPMRTKSASITVTGINALTENDTLDGYKPKNNKLLTYPYTFFNVDNANGNSMPVRYEFFKDNKPEFSINTVLTQPVKAVIRPTKYKGIPNTGIPLYTESLELTSYPLCSWNNDAYQAWLAQNSVPLLASSLTSIAGGAVSGALVGGPVGAIVGGVVSGVSTVSNVINQGYQASISADISRGSFNNGGINVSNECQQFYGGRMSITYDYAKMIDGYFTMYGYAVNEVKRPSRHNRENFTYVKMRDASATGQLPASALREIEEIYNNGIRFWVDPKKVGNYLVSNKPIGGEPVSEVSGVSET